MVLLRPGYFAPVLPVPVPHLPFPVPDFAPCFAQDSGSGLHSPYLVHPDSVPAPLGSAHQLPVRLPEGSLGPDFNHSDYFVLVADFE